MAELLQAWAAPVEGAGLRSEGLDQAIRPCGSANSAGQHEANGGLDSPPGKQAAPCVGEAARDSFGAAARRKREMVQAKEKAAARREREKKQRRRIAQVKGSREK